MSVMPHHRHPLDANSSSHPVSDLSEVGWQWWRVLHYFSAHVPAGRRGRANKRRKRPGITQRVPCGKIATGAGVTTKRRRTTAYGARRYGGAHHSAAIYLITRQPPPACRGHFRRVDNSTAGRPPQTDGSKSPRHKQIHPGRRRRRRRCRRGPSPSTRPGRSRREERKQREGNPFSPVAAAKQRGRPELLTSGGGHRLLSVGHRARQQIAVADQMDIGWSGGRRPCWRGARFDAEIGSRSAIRASRKHSNLYYGCPLVSRRVNKRAGTDCRLGSTVWLWCQKMSFVSLRSCLVIQSD